MEQLRQVFTTPDGKTFDTRAEALNYLRRPKVKAAMMKVANNQEDLVEWLVEHQEQVEIAFETGTIRRVTKSESKKLAEALEHVAAVLANDKKASFVVSNIGAIKDSFRWPSVKRMDEAEKLTAARNSLAAASEGNEELADWVIQNKTAILEAYEAGVEKRQAPANSGSALEAYRAEMAFRKQLLAEKGQEALDKHIAAYNEAKAAKAAAK